MSRNVYNPDLKAVERLAQFRRARQAGDRIGIETAVRDMVQDAAKDLAAQARIAFTRELAALGPEADGAEVREAEARAFAGLPAAVRQAVLAGDDVPETPPEAKPVAQVATSALPTGILSAVGEGGCVVAEGAVAVLAGEGGIAKSALVNSIAYDLSACGALGGSVAGELFTTPCGGPVVLLCWEDPADVVAWRLKRLDDLRRGGRWADNPLERVHVVDMLGWPLFGPGGRSGNAGLYNATPERLRGWDVLERAVASTSARLVIVDPVMSAFTGESNAAGPVREFLGQLALFAREHAVGVLLVAHSTKDARRSGQADVFDAGRIAGSSHWTDGVRGVMTMQWKPEKWGGHKGERIVAIPKANWGAARIWAELAPEVDADSGMYVGMRELRTSEAIWRNRRAQPGGNGSEAGVARSEEGLDLWGGDGRGACG